MRSRTGFSIIVAGLRPFGARGPEEPRSSRKRFSSARWFAIFVRTSWYLIVFEKRGWVRFMRRKEDLWFRCRCEIWIAIWISKFLIDCCPVRNLIYIGLSALAGIVNNVTARRYKKTIHEGPKDLIRCPISIFQRLCKMLLTSSQVSVAISSFVGASAPPFLNS